MNYEFLKAVPQMDKLHTACCDAERFIGTEPNYAVAAARRSIEYMVKLLYGFRGEETPIALHIAERVLTLPLYPDLAMEDVDRICEIITD